MYTKVDDLLWNDAKFISCSDDARMVFLYLITCPHRNMSGMFHLPMGYGSEDMRWKMERFAKGFAELFRNGFLNHDPENSVVFIRNYIKYNQIENPNQVKAALRAIEKVSPNSCDAELMRILEQMDKPLLKPLVERLRERLPKGYVKPVNSKQSTVNSKQHTVVASATCVSVNFDAVMKCYNETCKSLPHIRDITDKRKRILMDWGVSLQEMADVFGVVEASDFLTGRKRVGDSDWSADFDWILKPDNRQKIIEGKYANKTKGKSIKDVPKRDCFEQRVYEDEFFDKIANSSLKNGMP